MRQTLPARLLAGDVRKGPGGSVVALAVIS
jgi:hypothetical protein